MQKKLTVMKCCLRSNCACITDSVFRLFSNKKLSDDTSQHLTSLITCLMSDVADSNDEDSHSLLIALLNCIYGDTNTE